MNTIDLQRWNIHRPEKIRWIYPRLHNPAEVLTHLKSKTLRKFVTKIPQLLEQKEITSVYQNLTKDEYLRWLEFYQQKMAERHYDIIAQPEWYDTKIRGGFSIEGILLHHQNQLVGGGIVSRRGTELAILSFKASERLTIDSDKNSSLGSVIDYLFLKNAAEHGIIQVTGGSSRNAFGVINSVGYLDYKLRFGYVPTLQSVLQSETILTSHVPVTEAGQVIFYGLRDSQLALCNLHPKDRPFVHEVSRFNTPECPFIDLPY